MKSQTDMCPSCEKLVAPGQTHCSCGRPTAWASFADRASYEVSQWRAHRERVESAGAQA